MDGALERRLARSPQVTALRGRLPRQIAVAGGGGLGGDGIGRRAGVRGGLPGTRESRRMRTVGTRGVLGRGSLREPVAPAVRPLGGRCLSCAHWDSMSSPGTVTRPGRRPMGRRFAVPGMRTPRPGRAGRLPRAPGAEVDGGRTDRAREVVDENRRWADVYAYMGVVVAYAPVPDHRSSRPGVLGGPRQRPGRGRGVRTEHGEFSPGSSAHRASAAEPIDSRYWVRASRGRGAADLRGGGGRRRARGPVGRGRIGGSALASGPRAGGQRLAGPAADLTRL